MFIVGTGMEIVIANSTESLEMVVMKQQQNSIVIK